jgi:hypothetical protein
VLHEIAHTITDVHVLPINCIPPTASALTLERPIVAADAGPGDLGNYVVTVALEQPVIVDPQACDFIVTDVVATPRTFDGGI